MADELINAIMKADQIEDFDKAVDAYHRCLDMIPKPVYASPYALQLFMTLGEMFYLKGNFETALGYFNEAVKCSGGLGYAHLHLRLGQIRFEIEDFERARDELMRAYMGGDLMVFEGEDPKYYELIKKYIENT